AASRPELPTMRSETPGVPLRYGASGSPAQATTKQPAKLIARAESGEVMQEYLLEKPEIAIGRAPNSDILLSKDKLASRRHATIRYDNGQFLLRDERSANGTFVNGQQLEETSPRILQNGDRVGIGEYELIFQEPGSPGSAEGVVDLPTIAVPYDPGQELTYRTREDELPGGDFSEVFHTKSMDAGTGVVDIPIAPPYVSPPGSLIPPLEEGREAASRPGQAGAIYKPLPDIIVPGQTTSVVSPEQLRFTAFHPKEVAVDTWNTLLVYAHIEPASQAIYADADKFKHELGNAPRKVSAPGTQLILREK